MRASDWTQTLDRCSRCLLQAGDISACSRAVEQSLVPHVATSATIRVPALIADLVVEGAYPLRTDSGTVGTLIIERDASLGPPSADERQLLEAIADRAALSVRQCLQRTTDREAAHAFQHTALGFPLPLIDGFRFDAYYAAGQSEALVGGDWYDAFRLPDGRILIAIGDVMGSGISAAVQMMNVRQTIRGIAYVHADPAVMLDGAEHALNSQFPGSYVTAFVGIFDPMTHVLSYANAGHPPVIIRQGDGLMEFLDATRVPLGVGPSGTATAVRHTSLEPGTIVVLYTDGLIESTRDVLKGLDDLRELVETMGHATTAQLLSQRSIAERARDDVAILTMSYDAEVPVRRWRFDPMWSDAAHRVHREVCAEFRTLTGCSGERLSDLEFILAEIFSNLVRHAPGTAQVILELNHEYPVVHVLDKGPGFHFFPHLPADLFSESGRGLYLVSKLAASFSVERQPGGGSHARISV